MKSKLLPNLFDSFDSPFEVAENWAYTNFLPPAVGGSSADIPISLIPALTSEAAESISAQGETASVLAMTTGGITINLLFDAAAMAAPASFRAAIQQAASLLTATISDKITVNIKIDYSGTGGGAAAGPDAGLYQSYSSVRNYLINNATPGDSTFNTLPGGTSIQGQSNVAVWNAQLKLWGVIGANDTSTDDGSATFATDINPNLLVGVALHELTHAMGRVPYGPQPDIFDLFRFTSVGTRLFSGTASAPAAYFSIDGGNTKLADYGRTSDSSDFLNSGVQGSNDPFNEFYNGGTLQILSAVDKQQLDALGFHTMTPVSTVIEALGSTSLVQVGSYYYLNSISTGVGPQLKYAGSPVVTGQFTAAGGGTWALIGAEQTASGYQVAWKVAGVDQYTVWNLDSNGNYITNAILPTSGTSLAIESVETSFHQDLNGDGLIGTPVTTVMESFGSTSLVQVGSCYYLNSISTGVGPQLKYAGSPVVTGQFTAAGGGTWALIGAEQTASGYQVAWKVAGVDQYTVWNLDSNGNYITNAILPMSGTSLAIKSIETGFHQDLNGDGVIGIPSAAVIESLGSTSLMQVGSIYFLESISTGLGTELKYAGSPVVTGQFTAAGGGTWALIGAEQTASGYQVAWKVGGVDQYTVWNLDSNGNYITNSILPMSGTSLAIKSVETSFHQDLNGDGVIGIAVPQAAQNMAAQDTGTSSTGAQPAYMAVGAGADAFLFRGDPDPIWTAGSGDKSELGGFASAANVNLTALLNDVEAGTPQSILPITTGDLNTMLKLGDHDGEAGINFHFSDPHVGNFIIS
jgi:20S proteasome alpha/beta subunit